MTYIPEVVRYVKPTETVELYTRKILKRLWITALKGSNGALAKVWFKEGITPPWEYHDEIFKTDIVELR